MNLRKTDIYGLLACALLTLLVVTVGFGPILEHRAQSAQQRQALVEKRQQAQQMGLTLANMRQRLTSVERAADESLQLEAVDRLNHRLGRLTALASAAGLEIDRVTPGEPIPGEHYEKVPIAMSGRGNFAAARAFLHTLHGELEDLSVAGMTLSRAPAGSATAVTPAQSAGTFAFELQWYAAPRRVEGRVGR